MMLLKMTPPALAAGGLLLVLSMVAAPWTRTRAASPAPLQEGFTVFKSANCMGCHKWSGIGGGGYGGAAASLRKTELGRDQIIATVHCGRPGTGMPHFDRDAYKTGHCYGLKESDLSEAQTPPEPDHYLTAQEIAAVADYVIAAIKGRGDPTYAECVQFFGEGGRVCDSYPHAGGAPSGTAEKESSSHHGLQIERAPDANAPHAQ